MIIVHSKSLTQAQITTIENALNCKLSFNKNYYWAQTQNLGKIKDLSQNLKIDINVLPENFNPKAVKLIISDMDSTLITIECIDEIADFVNLKPKIAAITEQAMRGEIDFDQALKQRVKLLKGVDIFWLEKVYKERLKLNLGAETLIKNTRKLGIKFALVSGGFDFFTTKLKQQLNLDFAQANVLGVKAGKLTGVMSGSIINADKKLEFLHQLCQELNIKPAQVIAVGDGANDLKILKAAGLSVAFKAKPKVQQQSLIQINHSGLNSILDFLS